MQETLNRIHTLNDEMTRFIRAKKPETTADIDVFNEIIFMAEVIKENEKPVNQLYAELRGLAVKIQPLSPAVTAYMNIMADEFQTLQ